MLRCALSDIRRKAVLETKIWRINTHKSHLFGQRFYASGAGDGNGKEKKTKTTTGNSRKSAASKIIPQTSEIAQEKERPNLSATKMSLNPVETVELAANNEENKTEGTNQGDASANEAAASEKANGETLETLEDEYLTTIFESMEPYMDTYSVYTQLQEAGFTGDQADQIINLLITQLNTKLSKLSTKYSQLFELENEKYLFESAQQELRVDITRSREKHINELVNLLHLLERDFNILRDELNGDFIQMKNDTQVATNDQKSENTLLSKKIILRIQETNHKITTELNSAMRSEIESLRWHISRWGIMAILVSVFSGCTTFYIYKVKTTKAQHRHDFVPLVIYEPSEYEEDDYHTDLDKNLVV